MVRIGKNVRMNFGPLSSHALPFGRQPRYATCNVDLERRNLGRSRGNKLVRRTVYLHAGRCFFAPFTTSAARSIHISDVETMGIVMGVAVWVSYFRGTTLGIDDNTNALHWVDSQRARYGVALQMPRALLKWIAKKNSDFAALYARSHRNISAGHLTRLDYDEVSTWAPHRGFGRISHDSVSENWKEFAKIIEIGGEWNTVNHRIEGEERAIWANNYGVIADWSPMPLEIGRICREKGLPIWVTTPKHSMMDLRFGTLGVGIRDMYEKTDVNVLIQTGMAKTEYEILDSQYRCEKTGEKCNFDHPDGDCATD